MKRILCTLSTAVLLVSLVAAPAHAETRAVLCESSGTVEVRPGLHSPSPENLGEPYKVKIDGELTNCQSTDSSLKSGELKATVKGEGTCVHRAGLGEGTITWNNGNQTPVTIRTTDEAAVVVLLIEATGGNEPAMKDGDHGLGIAVLTADREKCNTPEGVKDATFDGYLWSGSPN